MQTRKIKACTVKWVPLEAVSGEKKTLVQYRKIKAVQEQGFVLAYRAIHILLSPDVRLTVSTNNETICIHQVLTDDINISSSIYALVSSPNRQWGEGVEK